MTELAAPPVDDSRPAARAAEREEVARRSAPDPGIVLPRVAVPTVLVWLGAALVWVVATVVALRVVAGDTSPWWLLATVPAHASVTFSMFTVLHESVHHAAGQARYVNDVLGRLAMPFVAVWGTFPMIRYLHIEHHRNTNEDIHSDPDAWTEQGPAWQLPLRWLAMDLWYFRFYLPRLLRRPRGERLAFIVNLTVVAVALTALVTAGHGAALLAVYLVPQRLGIGLLAWWFDWLPHHDLDDTAETDRFRATRVRVGWERLMTPLMFSQNYHLVHHVHPAIPFYRYLQAWRNTEADYLERQAPIATAWGRTLDVEEYRAWRELTEKYTPHAPRRTQLHPLRVADVRALTTDAVCLTLEVPDELRETFRFRPGQHLAVEATIDGQRVRRTYSICSPAPSASLRIGVKRVDGGTFSTYATTRLRAGDTLDVLPPDGLFALTEPQRTRHLAAVAAGSGITPVLSILAAALAAEPHTRATLLFANRGSSSTMFRAELDALVAQHDGRLQVVHLHSRPSAVDVDQPRPHQRVVAGHLTADRLSDLLHEQSDDAELGDADEWYLCGPQELTELVTTSLIDQGVPAADIHRELFFAAAMTPPSSTTYTDASALVTLAGRTTEITVTGDQTVLEAGLRAGLDMPYSCAGGACGTCKNKLLAGSVEMQQNYALSAGDVDAGWVLACQSRPRSERLRIDFDAAGSTSS